MRLDDGTSGIPLVASFGTMIHRVAKCHQPHRRPLFDHLVGEQQHRLGNAQAERLRGLDVDRELELGRLLNRQIAGISTLEDAIDVPCRLAELFRQVSSVSYEAARLRRRG
jgi:hypothetical protein